MGRKKVKPFIDRKNASTFHLMHRSQRDVADDLLQEDDDDDNNNAIPISQTGMVLWPGDNNLPETNRKVMFTAGNRPSGTTTSTTEHQSQSTSANDSKDTMKVWREKLDAVGLLEDVDARGDRFLKPLTGTGTFLDARSGKTVDLKAKQMATVTTSEDNNDEELLALATMEVDRMFESIPLTTDIMDPEIAAALFDDAIWDTNNNDGNEMFEELNDDFVLMAAQEPELVTEGDAATAATSSSNDFDYDEHIRQLLEKARKNPQQPQSSLEHGQQDSNYFSNLKPLHEMGDDDEYDSWDDDMDGDDHGDPEHNIQRSIRSRSAVPRLTTDEERVLCEKFEQTLAEYDNDDFDDDEDDYDDEYYAPRDDEEDNEMDEEKEEYENEDDNTHQHHQHEGSVFTSGTSRKFTRRPLEGDEYVESALDDYLQEKKDDIYVQGTAQRKRAGGSSFTALIDNKLVWGTQWNNNNNNEATQQGQQQALGDIPPSVDIVLQEANERLAEPPIKPPPLEDVLFNDGKSYFSERQRNPWDCESILTTYSNLDNNPTTIQPTSSRRRPRRSNNNNNKAKSTTSEEEADQFPTLLPTTPQPILLSAKTGLPIIPSTSNKNKIDDAKSYISSTSTIQTLYKREKNETAEEKKARKLFIKQDRSIARIQKKVAKEVFSTEYSKKKAVPTEDITGKTVYRYS